MLYITRCFYLNKPQISHRVSEVGTANLQKHNTELTESKRAAESAAQRAAEQAKEARERVKDSSAEAASARSDAEKLRRELSAATGAHEQVSNTERLCSRCKLQNFKRTTH